MKSNRLIPAYLEPSCTPYKWPCHPSPFLFLLHHDTDIPTNHQSIHLLSRSLTWHRQSTLLPILANHLLMRMLQLRTNWHKLSCSDVLQRTESGMWSLTPLKMGYPICLVINHSELLLDHTKSHHIISPILSAAFIWSGCRDHVLWNSPALVVTINSYILDIAFHIQHM